MIPIEEKLKLDKKAKQLFIGGLIAFIIATVFVIFLPLIITKCSLFPLDVEKPNEIGDTLGGIMGPIVALIGVLLTFLAFWAQYVANQEQRSQFQASIINQENDKKEQQFENQFYEMLRLHKANVDEIKLKSFFSNIEIEKRMAFEEMNRKFKKMIDAYIVDNKILDKENYKEFYEMFFWGGDYKGIWDTKVQTFSSIKSDDVIERHQGYSAFLGHYFRHLYLIVKFVHKSEVFPDYKDKMRYLKILRAQLSNYEQILLFYNWLASDYGGAWEEKNGNHFFIEYKMIHNLWVKEIHQNSFFVNEVNKLIKEYNKSPKSSPLFEFQGKDYNKKWKI